MGMKAGMDTETICPKHPDEEGHCLHQSDAGLVCCWCGDLFHSPPETDHGEFRPLWEIRGSDVRVGDAGVSR